MAPTLTSKALERLWISASSCTLPLALGLPATLITGLAPCAFYPCSMGKLQAGVHLARAALAMAVVWVNGDAPTTVPPSTATFPETTQAREGLLLCSVCVSVAINLAIW